MLITSWLSSFLRRSRRLAPRSRRGHRIPTGRCFGEQYIGTPVGGLETLEDRTLLSIATPTLGVTNDNVVFNGVAGSTNTIIFSVDGIGRLQHNLGGSSGFNSNIDLDSTTAGDQTRLVTGLTSLTFNDLDATDNDTVTFDTSTFNFSNAGFTSLTINAGTVTLTGGADLNLSGAGAVSITAARNISLTLGSSITVENGALTMSANTTGASTGEFVGIMLAGATLTTSGTGNINLTGRGSTATGTDVKCGILLDINGSTRSVIQSTSTSASAGTITLDGTGGNGLHSNIGVLIFASDVTSAAGNIRVEGDGAGTGTYGVGVYLLNGGTITSTGNATVSVTGTGSVTGTDHAKGVFVLRAGSKITSVNGDITINGQGQGTGGASTGVEVADGGQIVSTGTAKVTLVGSGRVKANATDPPTGTYASGVAVFGANTMITSVTGDISITGTGGSGSSSGNNGVDLSDSAVITSTGSAKVTLTGNAGTGSASNVGVIVAGSNTKVGSLNGDIQITGNGGGNGSNSSNHGVQVSAGAKVEATGSAKVTVTGTGGNGTDGNRGVVVTGANSKIVSTATGSGVVSITGTGGGNTTNNYGVLVDFGAQLGSLGSGNVSVTGTGGGGTSNRWGVFINDPNTQVVSNSGDLQIIGTAGTGSSPLSVVVATSASVTSTTGNIALIGDKMFLDTAAAISTGSSQQVLLRPKTTMTVDTNLGSTVDTTANTLELSDAELDRISAGTIAIGSATSGSITVSAALTPTASLHLETTGAITVNQSIVFPADKSLTTSAGHIIHLANSNADITTTGSGRVELVTTRNVVLVSGSSISTVDGGITLSGNAGGTAAANIDGVDVGTATVTSSGTGNILLTGRGGNTSNNFGINIHDGAQVTSTSSAANAGRITITGTGGTGSTNDLGVHVRDFITKVSSVAGDITITGTGGGSTTGNGNYGVKVSAGAQIESTGMAKIVIDGTAGIAQFTDVGVLLTNPNTAINSVTGDIQITGNGSARPNGGLGILIEDLAEVTSAGSANITMTATGFRSEGLRLSNAEIRSTSSSSSGGKITLNGTSVLGTGNANGIHLFGGALITSAAGDIELNGIAGGDGTSTTNIGVLLEGANIDATGVARVFVNGTGGNGLSSCRGIHLKDEANITSASGDIQIVGTRGTGGFNYAAIIDAPVSSMSGNIRLIGDSMLLLGQISTLQTVTLKPKTDGTAINLGSTVDTTANTLELSEAELDLITAGTLVIGDSNSGAITVSDDITRSAATNLVLTSGGAITANGAIRSAGGNLTLSAANGITLSDAVATSGGALAMNADNDADGSGTFTLFAAALGDLEQQANGIGRSFGAADDNFGWSVAISGDTAIVGAPLEDVSSKTDAGGAWVFVRDGNRWVQQAHLNAFDAETHDRFGWSVAISGDTAVVGAWLDDLPGLAEAGSAYVYTRSGSTWSLQQKLTAEANAATESRFGNAVAIDGNTLLIGAFFEDHAGANAGAAYVFTRSGSTWTRQQRLIAPSAAADDVFGSSVAIDGDTAVISAYADDHSSGTGGVNSGSAFVFTRSGSTWSQQGPALIASDASPDDHFGESVAISGDTLVVGARYDDTAAGLDAGSAYVFTRSGNTWSEQAHLFAADARFDGRFGISVDISGETILVGASGDSQAGVAYAGSAYTFTRSSSTWTQRDKLTASDSNAGDTFGFAVSLSGDTAIVGAYLDDNTGGTNAGSAYFFQQPIGSIATGSGSISITAADAVLQGAVSGTSSLTLQPSTASRSIGIGGGSGDFNLNDTDLAQLADGFSSLTIGRTTNGTGTVDVDSSTFHDPLTIVGGSLSVTELNAGSNSITLTARTGAITSGGDTATDVTAGALSLTAGGDIGTSNAPLSLSAASLAANTQGTTNGHQFLQAVGPGTVMIAAGGLDAGTATVQLSGGTFVLTADDQINDLGTLSVQSGAVIRLNGFDEIVASLTGSGILENESGVAGTSQLTVQNGSDNTFSGTLRNGDGIGTDGSLSLIKDGVGKLTLSGVNTFTGSTNVTNGTLVINGSVTSNVIVTAPGVLNGSGTITGNVSGTGIISAGNSPGTLTINGNLTPTGTVNFEVNSPWTTAGTHYDQLVVSGAVDLSGATISFGNTLDASAPAANAVLTLIDKTSDGASVVGTNPAEGTIVMIGSRSFRLFYNGGDGNDVVLVENSTPAIVYVDDSFTQNHGQLIADADLGAAGDQPAIMGVTAFATLNAALAAVTTDGTVIVNGGTYSETVSLTGTRNLKITGTNGAQSVTIDDLSTSAETFVTLDGASVLVVGDADSRTLAGIIQGTGSVTKQGSGTYTLSGTNTFSGTMTITSGTLRLGNALAFGATSAGASVTNGATLDLNGLNIGDESLSLAGELINTSATAANFSGNIALTGHSILAGSGAITLSGTVNGPAGLNLEGTGAKTFANTVGTDVALNSLDQFPGAGLVTFRDNVSVGTSGVVFHEHVTLDGLTFASDGSVTLGSDSSDTLTISGGPVVITTTNDALTLNAAATASQNLTINLGSGAFTQNSGAAISTVTNSLFITAGSITSEDAITTSGGNVTLTAANGITLNSALTTGGGAVNLSADSDGDESGTLTVSAGMMSFWTQLTAADGAAGDLFGYSVALSSDGNTAIVGAYADDIGGNINQGSAIIFTRSGGTWTQQARLTAASGAAGDLFGHSVALSRDGNTALVGALADDVGSNTDQGSAFVFTRSGGSWTQQAQLTATGGAAGDWFGYSVALSSDGNTTLVGARDANVGSNVDQGSAFVFTRSGGTWTQQVQLTATGGAAGDRFGISVTLSSDGHTALVGASGDNVGGNSGQGSATIFIRSGGTWAQQAQLTTTGGAAGDQFGNSVALSSDGNTALVGAPGDDTDRGSAIVFTRSGGTWTQQAQLTAIGGAAFDSFGNSVTLSSDGNTALVGASAANVGSNADQGAATIFVRSGGIWTQQAQLTATGGALGDNFGISVALSSDGNRALVGAFFDVIGGNGSQGSAFTFARSPLGSISAGSGAVALKAADMAIAGTISSTATVSLASEQANRPILLGTEAAGSLSLTDAELDRITAGRIVIGNSNAGAVTFSAPIDLANSDTLEVVTGSTINDTGTTTVFTDTSLALNAVAGIGTTSPLNLAVTRFEATTATGGINVANVGALTIGGASDSLIGVSAGGGNITIVASSPLTVNEAVRLSGTGAITLTATDDASGVEPDALTINASVTQTGGGSISLSGETIVQQNSATVSAAGSGTVSYNANKSITLNGEGTTASVANGNLSLNAETIWQFNGADVLASGSGAISYSASRNINVTTVGTTVSVMNGALTMTAGTGIVLDGSELTTTGTGNIQLFGNRGGSTGIWVLGGTRIVSASSLPSAGTITLGSTAGAGIGIWIHGSGVGTKITSVTGDIEITGRGGDGSNSANHGVQVSDGAVIETTGSAKVNVTGTGGSGQKEHWGVVVVGPDSRIGSSATGTGEVRVTGTGGTSTNLTVSNTANFGVLVHVGGQISSLGSSPIVVTGTGGIGTDHGKGVYITGTNSRISSVDGDVKVTGFGKGTAAAGHGIEIASAGQIVSTGLAKLTLEGTGTNGTSNNQGVAINGANSKVISATGDINIVGNGGQGTTDSNHGVWLDNGGQVQSTGTASINITGTGGRGTSSNQGVVLLGTDSKVLATNGNVTLTGTGGKGTADFNMGVVLGAGSQVVSTGTANLKVTGEAGTGLHSNIGVYADRGVITAAAGNIEVNGIGGGTGEGGVGVYLVDGGTIQNTGTGSVTVEGTGSLKPLGPNEPPETPRVASGTNFAHGVFVFRTNSKIESKNGNLFVRGTAKGTGRGNDGVLVYNGGQIVSTGSGSVTVDAKGGGADGTTGNNGIEIYGVNTKVGANSGSVQITAEAGKGTSRTALGLGTSASVSSSSGPVTLTGDTMLIDGTATITASSTQTTTLKPKTPGWAINLGSTVDTTANTLELSDAELDRITSGTIAVGDANSGSITVSAALTPPTSLSLAAKIGSSSIQINQPLTLPTGRNLVFGVATFVGASITANMVSFPGSLVLAGNGNYAFNAGISGGRVAKTETSTWTLTKTGNSFSTLSVASGTVKMGAANLMPASSVIEMGSSQNLVGTFDLNGFSQTVAGLDVSDVSPNKLSQIITNSSTTAANLTVDSSTTHTFEGQLTGNLGLAKSGIGTLTLAGNNTHSGGTTVSNGTLLVTGSLPKTGVVTVQGSGVLGGSGEVGGRDGFGATGTLNINSPGSVAPSHAFGVGTLRTGNVAIASGANFNVDISSGAADQLAVTGTVNLGEANLNLSLLTGVAPFPGQQFTLIDNDGTEPVVGQFKDLPEGSPVALGSTTASISYKGGTGNDVVLKFPTMVFPVNSLLDSGPGTLRGAIEAANQSATNGQYLIKFNVTGTINLTSALPSLDRNITIQGPGVNTLTVRRDNANAFRIFEVNPGKNVSLSGLTIQNGSASVGGGIFNNLGTLTISNCILSSNSASGDGGAIFNLGGNLTVTNSTFVNNSSSYGGGINSHGLLTITGSTFQGNTASNHGGGLSNSNQASVINSTFTQNSASTVGGAIFSHVTLAVANSTIVGNTATNGGGGIYERGDTGSRVDLKNSLIAINSAGSGGRDFQGRVTSQGNNLIGDPSGSSGWGLSDLLNRSMVPYLGSLASHGGPTQTIPLLQPLVNGVIVTPNPAVNTGNSSAERTDQRGFKRVGNADIGAFEFGASGGQAIAGYLVGSTVFFDADLDETLDPEEPFTITEADGSFDLAIPEEFDQSAGQLVLIGGVDSSTGLPVTIPMTAPAGYQIVSPLTTLVNTLVQEGGQSAEDALANVQQSLGLPSEVDLATFDPIAAAASGDANAAAIFEAEVKLNSLVTQAAALATGANTGSNVYDQAESVWSNLAELVQDGSALADLSDAAAVRPLLNDLLADAGATVNTTVLDGAAEIFADLAQVIDDIPVSADLDYVAAVVSAQVVAESEVAPLLQAAAAGTGNINDAVADYTDAALQDEVDDAEIGVLVPPSIVASSTVTPINDHGTAKVLITLSLDSDTPPESAVSVQFATADGTATSANGDYVPVSGTITWNVGDTADKVIVVEIGHDDVTDPALQFQLLLSNAQEAVIDNETTLIGSAFDVTGPTADIVDVSPNPRGNAVGVVAIEFSEAVTGVDISDFTLTRDGTPITLAESMLIGDGDSYSLDLSTVTGTEGTYALTLNSTGTEIVDSAGLPLLSGASETWSLAGTLISQTGSAVTITDTGNVTDDDILVSISGSNLRVRFEDTFQDIPLADISSLTINAGTGDDTLTLDLSNGLLPFSVTFHGGTGGNDSIVVTNAAGTVRSAHQNAHDGSITFLTGTNSPAVLNYTGLEPITIGGSLTDVIFDLTSGNDGDVTLTDLGTGRFRLSGSTFEQTDFDRPVAGGSITINLGSGDDVLTLGSLSLNSGTSLAINGGNGTDDVNLDQSLTLTGAGALSVTAETIDVDAVTLSSVDGHQSYNGTLRLSGSTLATGGQGKVILDGNLLLENSGSSTIRGKLDLIGATRTLIVTDVTDSSDSDLTIDAVVSGTGGILLQGGGTLSLNGVNTFTGGMVVEDGGLVVNGSLVDGVNPIDVAMASGMTLSGVGTIAGAVLLEGHLAPGVGPGILRSGNVTLASDSTFDVQIGGVTAGDSAGHHDQLRVTGVVTIASDVRLNWELLDGVDLVAGSSLILIQNDGNDPINGEFSELPEGLMITDFLESGLTAMVTYTGNAEGSGTGNDLIVNLFAVDVPHVLVSIDAGRLRLIDFTDDASDVTVTLETRIPEGSRRKVREFVIRSANGDLSLDGEELTDEIVIPISQIAGGAKGTLLVFLGTGDDAIDYSLTTLNSLIVGGEGDDLLNAGAGRDTLLGGVGNDVLRGGAGHDRLEGGDDEDQLMGEAGNDTLIGGLGHDRFSGDAGVDLLHEVTDAAFVVITGSTMTGLGTEDEPVESLGIGIDRIRIDGGDSDNVFDATSAVAFVTLVGNGGDDTLRGGSRNDVLIGGPGNNRLEGNAGNDSILGGDDADTILGGLGNDVIEGGDGDDEISGGANNDRIKGGMGDDFINGDQGRDSILGGRGDDVLRGGPGKDRDLILGEEGSDDIDGGDGKDLITGGGNGFIPDDGDSIADDPDFEIIDSLMYDFAISLSKLVL